ncbi:SMI1 / KNR4 family (SUKH-1) [Streptosporangium subroseum]|uniref:SMI1 / KNR4 family (SUKH-1) n=1 Tax=Streptosporangium subroseum TaxID=106412 RepID=A0A239A2U7_9ACTN|nr:SMI1/KNR4 family protein [Streptosporangium subroseum]SNR89438.1 SMI1 / KNR4 family (SUKH-1) [Streptosporangium subroseum]
MLKLITSRWVRFALVVAAVAAIVATVLRLRPARQGPAIPGGAAEGPGDNASRGPGIAAGDRVSEAGETGSASDSPWPPVPILGLPTGDYLARYAAGRSTPKGFSRDPLPRFSLSEITRNRPLLWGVVGLALCLLVFGTQVLENTAFSKEVETVEESAAFVGTSDWRPDEPDNDLCPEMPDNLAGERPDDLAAEGTYGLIRTFGQCLIDVGSVAEGSDAPVSTYVDPGGLDSVGTLEEVPSDEMPVGEEPVPVREPVADADCRPEVRAPRVRAVSPGVTRAVNRQWRRIETWLKTNAPKTRLTLGRPGKARTIAVAEAQMGLRFPDDLRASLLRHDGAVSVEDTWAFGFLDSENQGVRGIRDTWRGLCEADGEERSDDPRSDSWDGRMIPIGADGSGNHLVIDSVVGDVGDTDNEGTMSFTPGEIRIGSYYELLKATANALETGGFIGYWKPEVVDGELEWNIPD